MLTTPRRYRFDVATYRQLKKIQLFNYDVRTELIAGDVTEIPKMTAAETSQITHLTCMFTQKILEKKALLSIKQPVRIDNHSEFVPDIALLQPKSNQHYTKAGPNSQDVLLIIEVADITLDYEKSIKIPHYAKNGVSEVWLLDLNSYTLTLYLKPFSSGYERVVHYSAMLDRVKPFCLPHFMPTVQELFG